MNPYKYKPAEPADYRTNSETGETIYTTDLVLRRRRLLLYFIRSISVTVAISVVVGYAAHGNPLGALRANPLIWLVVVLVSCWATWMRNTWGTELAIHQSSVVVRDGGEEKRRIELTGIRSIKLKPDSIVVTYEAIRPVETLIVGKETFNRNTWLKLLAHLKAVSAEAEKVSPIWGKSGFTLSEQPLPSLVPARSDQTEVNTSNATTVVGSAAAERLPEAPKGNS